MNEVIKWLETQSCPAVSSVTIVTSQPCCSQSELYLRNTLLSLTTFVKPCFPVDSFLFAITSSHQQCRAESQIRLPPSSVSSVWYSSSPLPVKSADWCCVLTGLPLNSCLVFCNYLRWCALPPCGVTLCLLARISDQASLFLCGSVLVSQSLHVSQPSSVLNSTILVYATLCCCYPQR